MDLSLQVQRPGCVRVREGAAGERLQEARISWHEALVILAS